MSWNDGHTWGDRSEYYEKAWTDVYGTAEGSSTSPPLPISHTDLDI